MLIIVPCGKKKRNHPCRADRMYLGSYHRLCMAWARQKAGEDGRILILSALYGLLDPETEIAPYNRRFGDPGCILAGELREQAEALGLLRELPVLVLGGRDYTDRVKQVWPHAKAVLAGRGGIGKQLKWLKEMTYARNTE